MRNVLFNHNWDAGENNLAIYPSTGYNKGKASKREIIVMLNKLSTAKLWCHLSETVKIGEFVSFVKSTTADCVVDKGIHEDKYAHKFGWHMSVALQNCAHAGLKCHLYGGVVNLKDAQGKVAGNGAWEINLVTLFDSRVRYEPKDLTVLQLGEAPRPPAVVISSGVPPAVFGSLAYTR